MNSIKNIRPSLVRALSRLVRLDLPLLGSSTAKSGRHLWGLFRPLPHISMRRISLCSSAPWFQDHAWSIQFESVVIDDTPGDSVTVEHPFGAGSRAWTHTVPPRATAVVKSPLLHLRNGRGFVRKPGIEGQRAPELVALATLTEHDSREHVSPGVFAQRHEELRMVSGEICIQPAGLWDRNYYHWLHSWLPSFLEAIEVVQLTERERESYKVVFPLRYPLPPLVAEVLTATTSVRLAQVEGPCVLVNRFLYIDGRDLTRWSRTDVDRIRLFAKRLSPDSETRKSPRIYVSRSASSRSGCWEDELQKYLVEAHDFEIVSFEGMTLAQQIAKARTAEVIIGLHGAGLANMIWANPGCTIIEISDEKHSAPYFAFDAQVLGHHHHLVWLGEHTFQDPIDLDVDFRSLLETLLTILELPH